MSKVSLTREAEALDRIAAIGLLVMLRRDQEVDLVKGTHQSERVVGESCDVLLSKDTVKYEGMYDG